MSDTNSAGSVGDKTLEILDKVIQYATTGNVALSIASVTIMNAVNIIADLFNSRRVTLAEVVDRLESQIDTTDTDRRAAVTRLKAELGLIG